MPVATPEVYAAMLDKAKSESFAYPAINVSSARRRSTPPSPASPRPRATASSRCRPVAPSTSPARRSRTWSPARWRFAAFAARGRQEVPGQRRAAHRPLPQGQARRLRAPADRGLGGAGQGRRTAVLPVAHVGRLGRAAGGEPRDRPGAAGRCAAARTSSSRSRSASSAARRTASRAAWASTLYTTPEDALATAAALGLGEKGRYLTALTFGNVHGVYKPGNVKLRPEILKAAQEVVAEQVRQGLAVRPGVPRRIGLAARGDLGRGRLRRRQDERRHRHAVRLHAPGRRLHAAPTTTAS